MASYVYMNINLELIFVRFFLEPNDNETKHSKQWQNHEEKCGYRSCMRIPSLSRYARARWVMTSKHGCIFLLSFAVPSIHPNFAKRKFFCQFAEKNISSIFFCQRTFAENINIYSYRNTIIFGLYNEIQSNNLVWVSILPQKIQVASRQVFISKILSLYCTKRIDFHCRQQIETPLAQIAKSFFFGFFLSLTIGKHHFKLTQSLWAYRKSWKLTHFQQWCTPTHKCHMLKYQRFNNRTSEKLQPNFFWLTGEILHFFLLSSIGCNMTSLMSSKASERRLSSIHWTLSVNAKSKNMASEFEIRLFFL